MRFSSRWCSLLLLPCLDAQDPPTANRSLADGLIRERIESQRLEPPRLDHGVELGAGQGSLVVLIRRRTGELELLEVQRGLGEHGPSPEPLRLDSPVEEAVEAEVAAGGAAPAQPPAPPPAEPPAAPAGPTVPRPEAAPANPAPAKPAPAARAKAPPLAELRLHRSDSAGSPMLEVRQPGGPAFTGTELPREPLALLLDRLAAERADSEQRGQLLIGANEATLVQDVVSLVELAAAHGFDRPMFAGPVARQADTDERALLESIPRRFGWRVERRGPAGRQPICDGELLFLLDGPTRWGDLLPLYVDCARIGIWRIGIVGQRDRTHRSKLPVPLPFDRAL